MTLINIPNWIQSCSSLDSILFSTFECLYDPDFFPVLLYITDYSFPSQIVTPSSPDDVHTLTYDPKVSNFPPNTSISIILKELMIEQWHLSLSYPQFYDACAPVYCSYSQTVRKENFLGIIVQLVSMLSGITVSLRFLTPHIVKLIVRLIKKF